jgi:hypothetical protein
VRIAALVTALLVTGLGLFGVLAPAEFVSTVRWFQDPPALYLAAAIRVAVGAVLLGAARESRAPVVLRVLGALILVGGLATPFFGTRLARPILESWSAGGSGLVRTFAAAALAAGLFILYAVRRGPGESPRRTA